VLEGEETEEEVTEETAKEIEAAAEGGESVEITWDMPRVLPAEGAGVAEAGIEELEEPIEVGGTQLVAVIYFAHESSQLNEADRDVLRDVVALHRERGGRIHLIGHSSTRADTEDLVAQRMISLDLSLKRANQVADGLMGLGAQQETLLVEAMADSELVATEATATEQAGNRRVEIFLEY
jgi:flagellar motor protein MotB